MTLTVIVTFDLPRASIVMASAAAGAILSLAGDMLYDYVTCPPIFRLEEGDYLREINLVSAICADKILKRFGTDWDSARSGAFAEKATDIILYDSIGYRKYLSNCLRRKTHPLTYREIGEIYGKLPTSFIADKKLGNILQLEESLV